jgi:hypothetical protein
METWLSETCREQKKIHEKELCVELVIYKDCNDMQGQQNIGQTLNKV